MRLINVLKTYADREIALEGVIDYARTIPPRVRAEGGSPDWFDGPISEWDDLSRGIFLDYVTEEEAKEIVEGVGQKGSRTYRHGYRFDVDRQRWYEVGKCRLCGYSHRDGNRKGGCPCPEAPGRPGPCACEGAGGEPASAAEREGGTPDMGTAIHDGPDKGEKPRPHALDLETRTRIVEHTVALRDAWKELNAREPGRTLARTAELVERLDAARYDAAKELAEVQKHLGVEIQSDTPPFEMLGELGQFLDPDSQVGPVVDSIATMRSLAIAERLGLQPAGTLQWMEARGYKISVDYNNRQFVVAGESMQEGGHHDYANREIRIAATTLDRGVRFGGSLMGPVSLDIMNAIDHEVGHGSVRMLLERVADAEHDVYYGNKPEDRQGLANGTEPRYKYFEAMKSALGDLTAATLAGEHASPYVKAWAQDERGKNSDLAGVKIDGQVTRASIARAANENFAVMSELFAGLADERDRIQAREGHVGDIPKPEKLFMQRAKANGFPNAGRAFLKLYKEASTRRRKVVAEDRLESGVI